MSSAVNGNGGQDRKKVTLTPFVRTPFFLSIIAHHLYDVKMIKIQNFYSNYSVMGSDMKYKIKIMRLICVIVIPIVVVLSSCGEVYDVVMPGENLGNQIEASIYKKNNDIYIDIPGVKTGYIDFILLEGVSGELMPKPIWMGINTDKLYSGLVNFPIIYGSNLDGIAWRVKPSELIPGVYRIEGEVRVCNSGAVCKVSSVSSFYENFRIDEDWSIHKLNRDYK